MAVAGVWSGAGDIGFRRAAALSLMGAAGVLAVTGGTVLSRGSTTEVRAFLGWGPDREEPATGPSLTAVGIFVFVSLPLVVAGLVVFG
jgi:hypothetical protein